MTPLRTGLIAFILAAFLAPVASAAGLKETEAQVPYLEGVVVSAANGTQVSPQAAVDPTDPDRRIVVASEFVGGVQRAGAWRWTGTAWTRTNLPSAGLEGRGSPDVIWGTGAQTWVAHVGEQSANGCAPGSGIYLSSATYAGSWSSSLILPNDDYTYDHVAMVRDLGTDKAVVVADARTHTAACNTAQTGRRIVLAEPYAPGDGNPDPTLYLDGHDPAVASLPPTPPTDPNPGEPRLLLTFVTPAGNVAVTRCQFVFNVFWSCPSPAEFPTGAPTSLENGSNPDIPIGANPDVARGPDGRLHLVYTVKDGGNTDAVYRWSGDEGVTWSDPVSVADPQYESADQFMPAVAVTPSLVGTPFSTGRVDVTFLDRRTDGVRYQPFSTSFAIFDPDPTATRSRNRVLDDQPQVAPEHDGDADVGDRLAVVSLGATANDPNTRPTLAWWPGSVSSASGDLINSKLNHGRSIPSLPSTVVQTAKNKPVVVGNLLVPIDEDGDPVKVTLTTPPSFGSLDGTTYIPAPGFAGDDAVGVQAEDGYGNVYASQRPLAVLNATPALPEYAVVSVPAGGASNLTLKAADADQETLTYALVGTLPVALKDAVTLTPAGVLTVAPGPLVRTPAPVYLRVQVSDSSPGANGVDYTDVPVKVQPSYVAFGLAVSVFRSGNAVRFFPEITDGDPEAGKRKPTYKWNFGDRTPALTTASPVHRYAEAGTYKWSVEVTMPRDEGDSKVRMTGSVDIFPAGVRLVQVAQRVNQRKRVLVVRLRSKLAGTVRVTLKAGSRSAPARQVALKQDRWRVVTVPLAALGNARSASLVVRFIANFAGPDPTPIKRKVSLR